MKTIIQYCQHPDKVGCTYYAFATALANDCNIVLTKEDLQTISQRMLMSKPWRRKSYNQDVTNKVAISYVKEKYNKTIIATKNKGVDTSGRFFIVGGYVNTSYVFDIKDGKLDTAIPSEGQSHARCIFYDNGKYYLVELFNGVLPHNVIEITNKDIIASGFRGLTYTLSVV